jgi:hypothetical protein
MCISILLKTKMNSLQNGVAAFYVLLLFLPYGNESREFNILARSQTLEPEFLGLSPKSATY